MNIKTTYTPVKIDYTYTSRKRTLYGVKDNGTGMIHADRATYFITLSGDELIRVHETRNMKAGSYARLTELESPSKAKYIDINN